jgi:hypothetical protein
LHWFYTDKISAQETVCIAVFVGAAYAPNLYANLMVGLGTFSHTETDFFSVSVSMSGSGGVSVMVNDAVGFC